MDVREYRKMLSKMFPSKYMKDKVKATPKKGKETTDCGGGV